MSESPVRKSRILVWILGITLAVPLLYGLSYPWLQARDIKVWGFSSAFASYSRPWEWARSNCPFPAVTKAVSSYARWCFRQSGVNPAYYYP